MITPGETYKELTASQITQDCLYMLKLRGVRAWRQNNLTVRGRKGIVTKGVPDILGYNKNTGLFVCVEIKKLGDVLSHEQREFLLAAHRAGALAMIGTQYKDGSKLIDFLEYIS